MNNNIHNINAYKCLLLLLLTADAGGCMDRVDDGSMATFQNDTGPIFCVAFSPDGKRLALGTGGFDARIWDATTGRELAVLEGHTSGVSSIAFSPKGEILAVGSWDKTVSLWVVAEAKRQTIIECNGQVSKVAFVPDGSSLAVAAGREVELWALMKVGPKQQIIIKADARGMVFTPDGRTLLTSGNDGLFKAWNPSTGEIQTTFKRIGDDILSIAVSRDGKSLGFGDDSSVTVLDYNAGQATKRVTVKAFTTCLDISPDGKVLAAGALDKTVKVWNSSNGRELASLTGHTGRINSVAFSPDGKTLASASDDRTVKLWVVPKP